TLHDKAVEAHGRIDAVVSTDGDSDRPLILGVDAENSRVRFFGGDLVGMVTAEFLKPDAVVVPISCNDAIDRGDLRDIVEPKTRIGSPFVIAGMEVARARGKQAVCGWEANGGFLTGSDIVRNGKMLAALPTRDAVLPIVAVLCAAKEAGVSVVGLFDRLPRRYSRAALLRQFPRTLGLEIVRQLSPGDPRIAEVRFSAGGLLVVGEDGCQCEAGEAAKKVLQGIREDLSRFFTTDQGFGAITALNFIDGVRVFFGNGDVAHLRPSGNADELRIYAVANTQARADAIAAMAVREPDGILRRLEQKVR
ncbi:MAG: phosphomannomutase, partial [Proteobacteria bacterium]|nr:phosphomannomutase [Pseudomonadota bacterium]